MRACTQTVLEFLSWLALWGCGSEVQQKMDGSRRDLAAGDTGISDLSAAPDTRTHLDTATCVKLCASPLRCSNTPLANADVVHGSCCETGRCYARQVRYVYADGRCAPKGNAYHIDPGGSANGNGSAGSPFDQWSQPVDVAKAGDDVYFKCGKSIHRFAHLP